MARIHRLQQVKEGFRAGTSPTMMRSGRMRRQLRTRSRMAHLALAFEIGRAGFEGAPHGAVATATLRRSSQVMTRSSCSI